LLSLRFFPSNCTRNKKTKKTKMLRRFVSHNFPRGLTAATLPIPIASAVVAFPHARLSISEMTHAPVSGATAAVTKDVPRNAADPTAPVWKKHAPPASRGATHAAGPKVRQPLAAVPSFIARGKSSGAHAGGVAAPIPAHLLAGAAKLRYVDLPTHDKAQLVDRVWEIVLQEANAAMHAAAPSHLATRRLLQLHLLSHGSLVDAVVSRLAARLGRSSDANETSITSVCNAVLSDPETRLELGAIMAEDLFAFYERDPACQRLIDAVLYFKGFHAIQAHRLAHYLWTEGGIGINHRKGLYSDFQLPDGSWDRTGSSRKPPGHMGPGDDCALLLQAASSEIFQVDIHPACPVDGGFFIDHATGVVIGGTASIGHNVSLLHGITLGGTGKGAGDRHPKIQDGVLIGAGATILGNISVGKCSRVAAGSMVLKPVRAYSTVAGVPAKEVAFTPPVDILAADGGVLGTTFFKTAPQEKHAPSVPAPGASAASKTASPSSAAISATSTAVSGAAQGAAAGTKTGAAAGVAATAGIAVAESGSAGDELCPAINMDQQFTFSS
jgi:serine O-acetyltransferase